MTFIGAAIGLNGLIICVLPFLRTFGVLVAVRCAQNVLLGAFITADASIVVYTMGPHKSRPFTNALHAMVGVGFLFGTFLVRPFLPADATAAKDRDEVCLGTTSTSNSTSASASASGCHQRGSVVISQYKERGDALVTEAENKLRSVFQNYLSQS